MVKEGKFKDLNEAFDSWISDRNYLREHGIEIPRFING